MIKDLELPVTISRRDVRRVRLQLTRAGLLVVVPQSFSGDIKSLIYKHRPWIFKHFAALSKASMQAEGLEIKERTETELRGLIDRYLTEACSVIGVEPTVVTFREMKTRWGSCNTKGKINFNKKLRFVPDDLIRYVVFHEVCHLVHHNHSHNFWNLLAESIPNFKELKRKLKLYGLVLREKSRGFTSAAF
ncbi:MAG: M48 family metallopeptidase [Candidatus Doudnabacteria bacterium]